MATAEELLKSGETTEEFFVIDSDRKISVPSSLTRIAVQYDHNIETVTFDAPRYWDGHDLSTMRLYINFMRSDGYADRYQADNVRVEEDRMYFDWTISGNVTEVSGPVSFLVCAKSIDKEGNEEKHWNSKLCRELTVSTGMECSEQFEQQHPDIIAQLLLRIDAIEEVATPVLLAGDCVDSIVQNITESGGTGGDPNPKVLSRGAISLGRYTEAGLVDEEGNDVGREAMAVNYDTHALARASFAANISTTASKKGAASFGGSNTADGEFAFCGGGLANHTAAAKSFVTGYSNEITAEAEAGFAANSDNEVSAPNGASLGTLNKVKAEEGTTLGGENEVTAKRGLATGNKTKCHGAFGFTGGTCTEVIESAGAGVALGGHTITKAPYGYTGGAYCETNGVGGITHGLYLIGKNDAQAVFGKYNAPNTEALLIVGNGTADARLNAFEVGPDFIRVNGKTLTATTIDMLNSLRIAEGVEF